MKIVKVSLKDNAYPIMIGRNILQELAEHLKGLDIGRDAVIVTHPRVRRYHGKALAAGLEKNGFSVKIFEVPEGEGSKSAKVAFALMEEIARYDRLRQIFIVAFGGGVIGDLAGYVAAVYKRGVPYIQVPTTLLAQIDSAIGGKVAIDLPFGKNLVGAFYQPRLVYSDVSVLSSLDKRQIRNGLAEAVKYGVICDPRLFDYIAGYYGKLLDGQSEALETVVLSCSRIKAVVVMDDEKETKGIRTILNFGHTIGHAIEAAAGYNYYHHGEAVALGMRVAAEISRELGMLRPDDAVVLNQLLSDIGLPQKINPAVQILDIIRIMQHDKKFKAGGNRFVLARKIGRVEVVEDIPPDVIRRAIQCHMGR